MKPVGLLLKSKYNPTNKQASITRTNGVAFIDLATPLVYDFDNLPKPLLNPAKNFSIKFLFALGSFAGFSNNVHKAGVNDKATKAEISTAMPIVTANCWYNLPKIPGTNPTGINTAANINAMATTGPDIFSIARTVASLADRCSSSI